MRKHYQASHLIIGALAGLQLLAGRLPAQNLFVADGGNGDINRISPGGMVGTYATGFTQPTGLAFDASGDMFVADYGSGAPGSGTITEYNPGGSPRLFASGLNQPESLAFDAAGVLFEADSESDSVKEFTPTGAQITTLNPSVPDLVGLAFDKTGNLFLSSSLGSIYELKTTGQFSTFAAGLTVPLQMAFNAAGNLFVADAAPGTSGYITEITPTGAKSTFATGLNYPEGLAFNSAGNLFVGTEGGSIYEYTPEAVQSPFASGLSNLDQMAFQGIFLPVPEPTTFEFLSLGATAFLVRQRKKKRGAPAIHRL